MWSRFATCDKRVAVHDASIAYVDQVRHGFMPFAEDGGNEMLREAPGLGDLWDGKNRRP